MTESDWITATDPQEMLLFLRYSGKASERKLRLFAAACCRRVWHLLTDDRSREAVEVAERHADGRASGEDLEVAMRRAASAVPLTGAAYAAWVATWGEAEMCARTTSTTTATADARARSREDSLGSVAHLATVLASQAELVRCLFGNPFGPPHLVQELWEWSEGTVARLATAAYEARESPAGTLDPDRLAVLGDALEEAGADAELVDHLRGPGPHWRGCHVLDLLLGKG